jgi:WD40 repeat protein
LTGPGIYGTVHLVGHSARVFSAQFDSTGRWVVTGSADRTARVWDAQTGKSLQEIGGTTRELYFAAFSPTQNEVATAGEDHVARIYTVNPPESIDSLLDLARARVSRTLTPLEREQYLHVLPAP